ncbi:Eukaryotic translation initiation factor 3 subunit A, partial [Fragariocoptes setiger]
MPSTFLRIENALKRANEFIDVGKKANALETLCDAIRAKRHRSWQKCHEEIMFKYLELAVELRKSYVAKEGIFQYKLICQQTNIKSFEDVVRRYIELAEERAEIARNRSASTAINEIDDLDVVQSPENILLSAVSSEDSQDRSDRVLLIPWVRFLWEAYRQCLDLLKNNVRTESLYHEIAHQAFSFCIKYNRKTEFRKLCDNLRTHMEYLKKSHMNASQSLHSQTHMVNLNNPDSLAMHLETRLIQLESATQIELWQEAYRATDDIKRYGLMNLNKKPPKPQLMANYYQKLALVFWKANCHLFHAAALFRLFHLTRELKKNITPEEMSRMASKLVIATLTIPIPPNRPDIDKLVDTEENIVENHQRNLASLLGINTTVPTRAQLIKDLKRMGYLQLAYPMLQDLYRYLEVEFHPLELCSRVQSVIDSMERCEQCPDLKNYVDALKDISILRLLKEVSQVYQTIEYKRLAELCPFADGIYLETLVVEASRRNDLQVRIDHRKGCLHFGNMVCVSQAEEIIEGPHLQSMPSEQMRLQLVNMYSTLLKTRALIEPETIENNRERLKSSIMVRYNQTKDEEHRRLMARQNLIEERKKQLELLGHRMEQEERQRQEAKQRKLLEEETQRMVQERENQERVRKNRETTQIQRMRVQEEIERSGLKDFDAMDEDELAGVTPQEISAKKLQKLMEEQKNQALKQRRLERKIDHFERAKRIEEIPLLEKEAEKWKELDKKLWEECEKQRIADIIAERELAKMLCQRLNRITQDASVFSKSVDERYQEAYDRKISEFSAKLQVERRNRLEERKRRRYEERRAQYFAQKELAEREQQRLEEERKKREHEEELKRSEEKQRQKLKEVEDKLRKRKEEEALLAARVRPVPNIAPPPSVPDTVKDWRSVGTSVRPPPRDPIHSRPRDMPPRDSGLRDAPPRDSMIRDHPARGPVDNPPPRPKIVIPVPADRLQAVAAPSVATGHPPPPVGPPRFSQPPPPLAEKRFVDNRGIRKAPAPDNWRAKPEDKKKPSADEASSWRS